MGNNISNKVTSSFESLFFRFWLYFFPLSSFLFYNYVEISEPLLKGIYLISLTITFYIVFNSLISGYRNNLRYFSTIRLILFVTIFSMLMALIFWDQNLLLSFRVTSPYFAIVYFFFLLKAKPKINSIEKLIWAFCILYLIIWSIGLYYAPVVVFGGTKEDGLDDSRGIYRLYLEGRGFMILAFFTAISKYIVTHKRIWIFIFIFLFMCIAMHVIRQVIFFTGLVGLFYILKKSKYLWVWIFVCISLTYTANELININDNTVLGRLIAISEYQLQKQDLGEEDIRLKEYNYFFNDYSYNWITDIFGNGIAHSESQFGKMHFGLARDKGLYPSDVGYASIFIRLGIIGLLLYIYILLKVIFQKVPPKYMYAKLFVIYLFMANFTASWIFYDIIVLCLCIYILEYCNITNENNLKFL